MVLQEYHARAASNSVSKTIDRNYNLEMTGTDRFHREREFKESFEQRLPDFAETCRQAADEVILH